MAIKRPVMACLSLGLCGLVACAKGQLPYAAFKSEHLIAPPPSPCAALDPVLLAHVMRGLWSFTNGDPAAAVSELRLALLYDRGSEFLHEKLAVAWASSGELSRALAVLRDGLTRAPTSPALNAIMAELHADTASHARTIAAARLAMVDETLLARVAPLLVDALLWNGEVGAAEDTAREVLSRRFVRAPLARALGAALEDHGRLRAALAAYGQARAQHPSDILIVTSEARVLALLGRTKEASASVASLLEYYPGDADLLAEAARLLRRAGGAAAESFYLRAKREHEDDPASLLRIIAAQLATSYRKQAAFELARLAERFPRYAAVRLTLAATAADDGEAASCLTALGDLPRLYPRAQHLLARCLAASGSLAASLPAAVAYVGATTTPREGLLAMAELIARYARDERQATELLDELWRDLVRERDLAVARAVILDYFDNPEALRMLAEAVAKEGEDLTLTMLWVELASRRGERAAVIAWLRERLRQNREDPRLLNALGFTLAKAEDGLAEAEVLTRKAHRLAPDEAYIKDSLAFVLLRKGAIVDATRLFEEASAEAPFDAEILMHLGDSYARMGERARAGACYEKALLLRPPLWLRQRLHARQAGGAS